MIKINISPENREKIKSIMDKEIEKKMLDDILQLSKDFKKDNLLFTSELFDSKEKIKDICFLETQDRLKECIEKFETAKRKDIISVSEAIYNKNFDEMERIYGKLYENFSSRNAAYDILNLLNSKVCPYCNRLYTYTVKKKTKPEFDHFFPKKKYPYLSISIFNLVPSCGVCNKGKSNKESDDLLYPYDESFEDKDIRFKVSNTIPFLLENKNIQVNLDSEVINENIIKTYNDFFKIDAFVNKKVYHPANQIVYHL